LFLLLGIIFFVRTPTATVLINIDVDLKDQTLRFLLDEKEISAEKLAVPIELSVGDHELLVLRGRDEFRRYRFVVLGGRDPGIQVTERLPGPADKKPTVAADPDHRAAEWALDQQMVVAIVVTGARKETELWKRDELPQQTFRLMKVYAPGGARRVTDLAPLQGCKSLRTLWIVDARVTNDALLHIEGAENLEVAQLDGTLITDDGLRSLAKHRQLRELFLHRTRITEAGLVHLHGIHSLRSLVLPDTIDLNGTEVEALRRALPNCSVGNGSLRIDPLSQTAPGAGLPPEGEWTSLFNGKDLAGWQGTVAAYEVKEGVLKSVGGRGTLYTVPEFDDFVVQLEFRLNPGANSGLVLRYPGVGEPAFDAMCEIQMIDPGMPISDPRQRLGSAYGLAAAQEAQLKPAGEWNEQTVAVRGSSIQVKLNGSVILDADLAPISEFAFNRPHPGKDRRKGHVGFTTTSGVAEFRNIRIKRLGSAPAEAGFVPLDMRNAGLLAFQIHRGNQRPVEFRQLRIREFND
jgi:hypothetical protein